MYKLRELAQYEPITTSERDLAFHASGHVLHSRFWQSMHPNLTAPDPGLVALIDRDFGSSGAPRDRLSAAASPVKAAGWVALSWDPYQLGVNHILKHQHSTMAGATL